MLQKTLLIGLIAFIFLLFLQPVSSSDLFHHLITGQDILSTQRLPYTDTHSYTAFGKPWVAHSWGAALLFTLTYLLTGYAGLSVLFALIGTAASLFLFLILRKRNVPPLLSYTLTLLAASIISLRWPGRPELLGPLFLVASVYLLTKAGKIKWWLIPFFWIWGILYGSSAFLGIATVLLFIVTTKQFSKTNFLILLGSVTASMLNGYGSASFFYIFQIPAIAPHVGEWSPILSTMNPQIPELVLFYQYPVILYVLFTVFCMATLLTQSFSKYKQIPNIFFYLLLSLSLFSPYYTSRFFNLAPLISLPIIGFLLTKSSVRIQRTSIAVILLLSCVGIFARFSIFPVGIGLARNSFPTNVAAFLVEKNLSGNVYATQELGGYLAFTNPQIKVFSDTRDDLYQPLGIFDELQEVSEGTIPLAALLSKYKTDIIVADLQNGQSFAPLLYSPSWSLVFITDGFMVLTTSDITSKQNLITYHSLDPLRIPPAKPGQIKEAEKELRSIIRSSPTSTENTVRLIELLLAQGKNSDAKNLLAKTDLSGFYGARTPVIEMENAILKARILLANNECTLAYESLRKAISLRNNKLLLFQGMTLPSPVDLYLSQYYEQCEKDLIKASAYLRQYLTEVSNPRERLRVEQKLRMINNSISR